MRLYACIRRLSAQLFILLSPVAPSAYADCRRQSSSMLNFQGQRRHSSQSRKRSKVTEGWRVVLYRDVCGRIPRHTLACLYFYPRRNLRYAVAMRRQSQAWTSAPAASAYVRMEYKPGLMLSYHISRLKRFEVLNLIKHTHYLCITLLLMVWKWIEIWMWHPIFGEMKSSKSFFFK